MLRTAPGVASERPRRPASAFASASPSSSSMASMVTSCSTALAAAAFLALARSRCAAFSAFLSASICCAWRRAQG